MYFPLLLDVSHYLFLLVAVFAASIYVNVLGSSDHTRQMSKETTNIWLDIFL